MGNPTSIKFGTDGWRGIIADDFTYDNVALVGKAIVSLLAEEDRQDQPLIIGYDRRFAAEAYAAHLACYLETLGQLVMMVHEPCPTPVVAFGVKHLKAAGAVMLTASHNPYHYQGLKFIPHFAGPAMPATTDRITELIGDFAADFEPPELRTEWSGQRADLKDAYFEHLDSIVNQHSLSSGNVRVLYNPMHGLGAGFLDAYLKRSDVEVVTINGRRDVYFGGGLPDPSKANLEGDVPRMVEEDCEVLIGTDGDADRFGLLDAKGHYFGANHALPMLADYLVRYKKMKGGVVRTVATSHVLDGVAEMHNLKLTETAVGFKYVGDELRRGAMIGGEESGGISMAGHMPEKDGILAALLMLELAATSGESFSALYSDLLEKTGPRAYERVDQHMPEKKKQALLAALAKYDQPKFAGKTIVGRNELDGVKLLFKDGSWAMLRASGTEPVVRIYIETTNPEGLDKFRKQVLEAVKGLSG